MARMLFLFAIAALLVLPTLSVTCPADCNCTAVTFSCQVCLEFYYQVYSLESKSCECLPGFLMDVSVLDYCHPYNCKKSSDWGCAVCYSHAHLVFVDNYLFYNCTCDDNYYLNLTDYLCYCNSILHPQDFYDDNILDVCHVCPLGCKCDITGCYECNASTLRHVSTNRYSSTCRCSQPYIEIGDACFCPENCSCYTNGTAICSPESMRQWVLGNWVCTPPYINVNGSCSCVPPYEIVQTLGYPKCVCMSKNQPSAYYFSNGTCRDCPYNCTCDQTGCVMCTDNSSYIFYQGCFCNPNYIYQKPDCACLDPFEITQDPTTKVFSCQCLSHRLANYYSKGAFCRKCPTRCQCNMSGCFNCTNPLRVFSVDSDGFSICSCGKGSMDVNNLCKCRNLFVFNPITKICDCKVDPVVIYYDLDTLSCNLCPMGCTCSNPGCFSCSNEAYRSIVKNSQNISTCYCIQGFVEIDGICICPNGYQVENNTCTCTFPFFLNASGICVCWSQKNSSLYYFDHLEMACKKCPLGCICGDKGCEDCGSDFLRTTKYSSLTQMYTCPCLQNAFEIDNYCTICDNNSYPEYLGSVTNITCVHCYQCLTCNRYGCLTCPPNMTLQGTTCLCNNSTLSNVDGLCKCPYREYMSSGVCKMCPARCISCYESNKVIYCTSCNFNEHRYNIPTENCPCELGYKQSAFEDTYCCPIQCEECNEWGCTSCPLNTYRVLKNGSCICTGGFVKGDTTVCICPPGFYLLNYECFACPIRCETCQYNSSLEAISCLSCKQGVNRDTNNQEDHNCTCLPHFSQTSNFSSEFCYADFCVAQVVTCVQCIKPWKINTSNGVCICEQGYSINSATGLCEQCRVPGCIDCLDDQVCVKCNQEQNYYLVAKGCIKVSIFEYVAAQTYSDNIVLQGPLNSRMPSFDQIQVQMSIIEQPYPSVLLPSFKMNVISANLVNDNRLLTLNLQNINQTFRNVIISFIVSLPNPNPPDTNTTNSWKNVTNSVLQISKSLKMDVIYSKHEFDSINHGGARVALYLFVLIAVTVSFGFYVWGFKQNHLCFFMQSMSLIGFGVSNEDLSMSLFLFNLRYSYYCFSFKSLISSLIPPEFLASSPGNYRYLNLDANIIRNIGLPLVFAAFIAGLCVVLRIIYYTTRNHPLIKHPGLAVLCKKTIYRALEFFYKTLMYPLMFFSIQTLLNWDRKIYTGGEFRNKCNILSILIITSYSAVTLFQYKFQLISKLNKRENLKEFLLVVIGSLIIVGSNNKSKVVVLFILVFMCSEIPYIRIKKNDIVGYFVVNILKVVVLVFEVLCIILVATDSYQGLVGTLCTTIVLHMAVMGVRLAMDRYYDKLSKLAFFNESEQVDDGSTRDLEHNDVKSDM